MYRRTFSSVVGTAALVLVCTRALPSMAQTDEQRAGARSLATEGASAFNDGRYKDTVDLFTKAESLVHAPPHLLFIARANTKLGQLVKAREAYLKITKEQLPPNSPQAFRDAQTAASREMAAIDHKIGALAVKVEGAADAKDLQVKIDGNAIPSVLVGVSQPIDPGEHRIEAVATGYRAQPKSVKIGDGEKTSTTIKLDVDPNAAPAAVATSKPGEPAPAASASVSAPLPAGASSAGPASTPSDTGTSGGSAGMRIGAYSAFGVGAIGIGVGTAFLLKSMSKRSEANDICNVAPNNGCPPLRKNEIDNLDSEADSAQTLAIVGYAVGGAAVVTGILLLVLDKGSTDTKSASVTPWVGLGQAGIAGRF